MKKLLFAFCLMTTPAFAVLSPMNQSIREIQSILSSQEITQYFGQAESIQNIDREGNQFIIKTGEKQMVVEVVYQHTQRIGPIPFKLVFHPATPRD